MDHSSFDIGRIVASVRAKSMERTAEEREAYERDMQRLDRQKRLSVLKSWQVPKRTLRNLHPRRLLSTPALAAVQAWLATAPRDRGWCLTLSSRPGVGKSSAAAWWLLEESAGLEPSPEPVRRWCTSGYLLRVSSFDGTTAALAGPGPLVIDDLGVEFLDRGGHFHSRLDELLDERYSQMRPTLITTNLNAQAFKERYGDRITDRIREGCEFVEFSGNSLRGSAA